MRALLCLLALSAVASAQYSSFNTIATGAWNGVSFSTYTVDDAAGNPSTYGFVMPDFDLVPGFDVSATGPMTDDRVPFGGHPQQDKVPYSFAGVNFNPMGHPGGFNQSRYLEILASGDFSRFVTESPVFGVPHFDIHFYLPTSADIDQITCDSFPPCTGPNVPKFFNAPPAGFMPSTFYLDATAAVPAMGMHWEDVNYLPTQENGLFLREPVIIWGSYDGQMTFVEQMISSDAFRNIKANGPVGGTLPVPQYYARAGYYPTTWRAFYNATTSSYHVEFGDSVYACAGANCVVATCGCNTASIRTASRVAAIDFTETYGTCQ